MPKNIEFQKINMNNEASSEMFGCYPEDLYAIVEDCDDMFDLQSLSMGILSDAQQVMANDPNHSRQMINISKWLMNIVKRELRQKGI